MIKKITGIAFLLIASYFTTYSLYKILSNPNHLWLGIKEFLSGNFGTFSIVILAIYGAYLFIIFLLFKYGLKWTKLLQRLKLKTN
ncbi:hypothetical protein BST83_09145 [Polaribacter filamentus]|jgi:hypothetical protein|uniref:Uncharacterized protein n=1 Tax=Polaribacter filamentus TaxID=53483 RepID=A0A2S7KXB5_9FLAO|nr:hypothetical protein [Polaribacter filamentus]PQB07302.1 hypothetical protein BST83_09145 [Polaribacter filamentus]